MSTASPTPAARLASLLERATGETLPFGIRLWDGSTAGPDRPPLAEITSPRALRRYLLRPGRLALARALIAGEVRVEGDLVELLDGIVLMTRAATPRAQLHRPSEATMGTLGLLDFALRSGALKATPSRSHAELRARPGRNGAVEHHYNAGNGLYETLLGPSMVYSCAYWPEATAAPKDLEAWEGLETAQRAKLDRVCRKLRLRPGMRLLDVGCGWGSLLLHAAEHHGVHGVGVTLAREQAAYARQRIARSGLGDRIDVRLCDYREVTDGPYDAVSSIEVTQHLARRELRSYARHLHRLLTPGGRLLAHDLYMTPQAGPWQHEPFLRRYVFPRLNVPTLGEGVACLEAAGLEVLEVENLRHHFALTFRAWLANLEAGWDRAVADVGPERARAWRLYLVGGAMACDRNWLGAVHTTAVRTTAVRTTGVRPAGTIR
ncbi:class I SAM-dependent methyltransferase [Streptomyces sp. NPDC001678]|uniref:class I SAM-dependent methyltransferase n=1 Tax=Streptomyces sp. NPDC001678 TaxID=3364599 RepID=UPI0036C0FE0F